MSDKKNEQNKQNNDEKIVEDAVQEFDRLAYFTAQKEKWERKLPKLLAPAKIARAKRRIAHYTAKVEAEQKLA